MTTMICAAWERCKEERSARGVVNISHCGPHPEGQVCAYGCPYIYNEKRPLCRAITDEELVYYKLLEGK